MILPDLVMPSRVDQHWQYSGMDHINRCQDPKHFLSYPHNISYDYNSRGFRDEEWPNSNAELKDAVWCIGDSFTVGVGAPIQHTWPSRLSTKLQQRTINVSLDGASNEWMTRIAQTIVHAVDPKHMVIMWSHTHRREHYNSHQNDEARRIHSTKTTVEEDLDNLIECKAQIDSLAPHAVHFAIPGAHYNVLPSVAQCWNNIQIANRPADCPTTVAELTALDPKLLLEIKNLHNCLDKIQASLEFNYFLKTQLDIEPVSQLDLARDGHHFDKLTADWVAQHAVMRLRQ